MPNSVHSISIPSSTQYLGKVRRFVERYAIEANFSDETVNSLQLAADEACANIIEHAYSGTKRRTDEPDLIDIDVIIKPDRFIIRIRDKGQAFETTHYNEPDIRRYARNRKSGGFGVHLMRRLMDQVEYRTRGDSNECCLIKYRTKTKKSTRTTKAAKVTKSNATKPVTKKTAAKRAGGGKSTSKAAPKKTTRSAKSAKTLSGRVGSTTNAPGKSTKPVAKKSPAKKSPAQKSPARKAPARKSGKQAAITSSPKKTATRKPAKQVAKKSPPRKSPARKAPAKKSGKQAAITSSPKKTATRKQKQVAKKSVAKKTAATKATRKSAARNAASLKTKK